jgi:hypothetical protein
MFCPQCGYQDPQPSYFCRGCGSDLHSVRKALQHPDNITSAAVSARLEVGRAIADKIRTLNSVKDLKKITEAVLPEVQKFLESPAEQRLRRLRNGTITASVGLGVTILLLLKTVPIPPLVFFGWPVGLIVLFIGLGNIINGLFFSTPKQETGNSSTFNNLQQLLNIDSPQSNLPTPGQYAIPPLDSTNAPLPYPIAPPSVVEHTTWKLPTVADNQPSANAEQATSPNKATDSASPGKFPRITQEIDQ